MAASILQQIFDFVLEPAVVSIVLTLPLAAALVWLFWLGSPAKPSVGKVSVHTLAASVQSLILLVVAVAATVRLGQPLFRYGGFAAIALAWILYGFALRRRWTPAVLAGCIYAAGIFLVDEYITVALLFE